VAPANGYIDPSASIITTIPLIALYEAPENQYTSLEGDGKWDIVENTKPRRKVRKLSLCDCPRGREFIKLLFFKTVKRVKIG
jgi:hypothetical protein